MSSTPAQILFLGDTHGDLNGITTAARYAAEQGSDTIFQVGDFGIWPTEINTQRFLASLDTILERHGIDRLIFVDGNHDWHDRLEIDPDKHYVGSPEGFRLVEPAARVWHCPRGTVWEWNGERFGAIGGAFSVDRQHRIEGESWWHQEEPTKADLKRLNRNLKETGHSTLDVLITHDGPDIPPGIPKMKLRADIEIESKFTRDLIGQAVNDTHPRYVIHGHWHHRAEYTWTPSAASDAHEAKVTCLAHAGTRCIGDAALIWRPGEPF